jgi:hypothetical protein
LSAKCDTLEKEVEKIIILPTLVIRTPNLEIFLFCQHNSTGGGNLELRQLYAQIVTQDNDLEKRSLISKNVLFQTFQLLKPTITALDQ